MVSETQRTESIWALERSSQFLHDGSCSWLRDVIILFEFLRRLPFVGPSLLHSSSVRWSRVVQGEACCLHEEEGCRGGSAVVRSRGKNTYGLVWGRCWRSNWPRCRETYRGVSSKLRVPAVGHGWSRSLSVDNECLSVGHQYTGGTSSRESVVVRCWRFRNVDWRSGTSRGND